MQLYWNHTSAWVFSCKFAAYFRNNFFLRTPLGGCFCEFWTTRFSSEWTIQCQLKIKDCRNLINFLFVKDVLSNESLEAFSNCFTKPDDFHDHMSRHSSRHSVIIKHSNTQSYGSFSIRNKAASSWNFLQSKLNTDVASESHN